MKSKTKIVVVRMKEIIYTAIFLIFAVILILLLVFMFGGSSKKNEDTVPTSMYTPGVYTTSMVLNDNVIDVEVTVDSSCINGVRLVNLEDAIATMYPLLETCMSDIRTQLAGNTALDEIAYDTTNQYTYQLLTNAIQKALDKAMYSPQTDAAANIS